MRWARLCRVLAFLSLIGFGWGAASNLYHSLTFEPEFVPFTQPRMTAGWYFQSDSLPKISEMQAQHDALVAALRAEGVEVYEVEGVTGKFWNKRREISCKFRNPSEVDKIWALAEDQVATEPRPERLGGLRPMSVG